MPVESPTRFTMVPARRSSEPTARRRARRILVVLFLSASLSVVAVAVALAKGRTNVDLSPLTPQGRDLAHAAALNFLAGSPQQVPRASTLDPDDLVVAGDGTVTPAALPYRSITWTGFSLERFSTQKGDVTTFEVHHFHVDLGAASPSAVPSAPATPPPATPPPATPPPATPPPATPPPATPPPATSAPASSAPSSGAFESPPVPSVFPSPSGSAPADTDDAPAPSADVVQLDVSILPTTQGPRLAAAPALSVWTGGLGAPAGAGDYTDHHGLVTDMSEAAKHQIAQWARAYTNGDSAGLLTLTGDQNPRHRYVGLSGFTLPDSADAVRITSAIRASNGRVVARTRVLLAKAVPNGTASDGQVARFLAFADFDLLVAAPNGARPLILAWGPAGSAAGLEPYSNAIDF